MRRLIGTLLLFVLAAAACGDDDVAVEQPEPDVSAPAGERGDGALPIAVCDDIEPEVVPDGPLSDDPEIAAAQQARAEHGLRSDAAWVEEVAALDPPQPASPEVQDTMAAIGVPLTEEEVQELIARARASEESTGELRAYGESFPDSFAGIWRDNPAGGVMTIAFTDDLDARRAEVAERFPGVAVVGAEHSEAQLAALQERVGSFVFEHELGDGIGRRENLGVVQIDLHVLDEASVDAIAAAFPGDLDALCVTGADPADVVPEGPQPTSGDGWRLLGVEDTGMTYVTDAALDVAAYQQLWNGIGMTAERPAVDFADEIIAYFGAVYSSGCEDERMDDVIFDAAAAVVHPEMVLPGGARACNADARPRAYVVALDRERLPSSPFRVQLAADVICQGCEGTEVTVVDLDAGTVTKP